MVITNHKLLFTEANLVNLVQETQCFRDSQEEVRVQNQEEEVASYKAKNRSIENTRETELESLMEEVIRI
jgi:hypothetical protein